MAAKRSPSDPVTAWAREVVAGKRPANKLQRQAAERHLRDLDDQATRGLVWREDLAGAAVEFFKLLRHSKGVLAGQRFELQPWQQFIVGSLFGWVRRDGSRRYREAFVELPRKQGKTTLAAGVALLMAFFDREAGAEAYCAATKKDQARLVWDAARAMVMQSPDLRRRLGVFAGSITGKDGSKLVPLGADEDTLDGLNVHCAIIDEVHAHKGSGVVDVLKTATGARTQPLLLYITTAGSGRETVCYRLREYATRVLEAAVPDDSFFAFVACADPGDDWREEATWRKANPNLGVSVSLEQLRADAAQAERVPAWQARFRRLHLCEWLETAEDRALDLREWDTCARAEGFEDRPCWAGLDLASSRDFTAFGIVWAADHEGVVPARVWLWLPADRLAERMSVAQVRLDVWAAEGFIEATPGAVMDFDHVERRVLELVEEYRPRSIGYDPWGATQLVLHLKEKFGEAKDAPALAEVGQGFAGMSAPTKELLRLIGARKLGHNGNPVLRWMASNLVTREDPAGNLKPDRVRSVDKIDGIVALTMAIVGMQRKLGGAVAEPSVYESRGLLII